MRHYSYNISNNNTILLSPDQQQACFLPSDLSSTFSKKRSPLSIFVPITGLARQHSIQKLKQKQQCNRPVKKLGQATVLLRCICKIHWTYSYCWSRLRSKMKNTFDVHSLLVIHDVQMKREKIFSCETAPKQLPKPNVQIRATRIVTNCATCDTFQHSNANGFVGERARDRESVATQIRCR